MRNLVALVTLMAVFALPFTVQAQDTPAPEKRQNTPPPETILFESSVGDVQFPHKMHLKMRCNKCHHQIQAAVLETPHQDYLESSWIRCKTCHIENPDSGSRYFKCGQCHHSELENIADETLSAKVVVHKSCWKCHRTSTGVGASKSCSDCHIKQENGNRVETAGH